MVGLKVVKKYCKEYWEIENYAQAMADETQLWHCHHRLEEYLWCSREYLKKVKRYYDVPAEELIFLTPKSHHQIHGKLNANVKWLENNLDKDE